MIRLRFSTVLVLVIGIIGFLLVMSAVTLDIVSPSRSTTLVMRLWDENLARAYQHSLEEFHRIHPRITVRVDVVSYSSYFPQLRTDIAGRSGPDLFWLSSAYVADYAEYGKLLPVSDSVDFEPAVRQQFMRHNQLWAVPQMTDAGIALYYNKNLIEQAGINAEQLNHLHWGGDHDSLSPLLRQLTHDIYGHTPDDPQFDPRRIRQWGYNAANDPQAIYLNYLGSAGASFQHGDQFSFDSPQGQYAFEYLVKLINTDHVSPSAIDTNNNNDFSRNQFLAGHMAIFQSGTYNLATIAHQAPFPFGIALLPSGPDGRISVTNGIAVAGNAHSSHRAEVMMTLQWLATSHANQYLADDGQAIPAVRSAQQKYFHYWSQQGINLDPFFSVIAHSSISAPHGLRFFAGQQALKPFFDEMFLGHRSVTQCLYQAQQAANRAINQ